MWNKNIVINGVIWLLQLYKCAHIVIIYFSFVQKVCNVIELSYYLFQLQTGKQKKKTFSNVWKRSSLDLLHAHNVYCSLIYLFLVLVFRYCLYGWAAGINCILMIQLYCLQYTVHTVLHILKHIFTFEWNIAFH